MTITTIIIIILIGLLFLLLEILVIPGVGVAGIVGLVVMAFGIWQAFSLYGQKTGLYVLIASAVLSVLLLFFALRSNTWKKISLSTEISGKTNEVDANKLQTGMYGKSISRLAPAGKAVFNQEYYEVHSYGEFIDQNQEIEIVKIEFNKIFVKRKKT